MYKTIRNIAIYKRFTSFSLEFMKKEKTGPMNTISFVLIFFIILSVLEHIAISTKTLFPHQFLFGNQTLISQGGRFEFGFFSPGSSRNRYLGIWYKSISPLTIVWVANRNTPLTDSSGVLNMDDNGNLLLLNQDGMVIWSSNQSKPRNPFTEKPMTKLLDSGNLVVTQDNQEGFLWQSFNHATDTLLPGMKLGWDLETGVNNSLISWRSGEDPSTGDYSLVMESHNSPEIYLLQKHNLIYRSGPWNGVQFSDIPEMNADEGFGFTFIFNKNQKYYLYEVDETVLSRVTVDESGNLQILVWLGGDHGWISYWDAPKDQCDDYKECGAYGICNTIDSPVCSCMKGFKPRNEMEWNFRETSGGCVQKTKYQCGKDDGFLKLMKMKLPESSKASFYHGMDLKECREMCKKNCSCTGYANSDIRNGGSGCITWIGDLLDLREYPREGQDIYVRVAEAELDHDNKSVVVIITVTVIPVTLVSLLIVYFIWKKKMIRKINALEKVTRAKGQESQLLDMFFSGNSFEFLKSEELELQLIEFEVIVAITENFSDGNKLGQGGFGSVYKGTLAGGQNIAVKRLSKDSGQGVDEFMNEVLLIAKLQHRNLVRLMGSCINNDEKMLIYEYMPNKGLDSFLFDRTKRLLLDWPKRFNIIMGIARGLLYLHQDSRLKIIHRDLKASNILLDDEMNPKISDFGMARIFGGNQTEANTRKVVGTIGYMSPEYAMDGIFSVKSDVFSYGVLILEIISGKKNKGFFSSSDELNLLGRAWRLWEEGKVLELMDKLLDDTGMINEVLKCIQVGLLCVQEHAEDRPSISSVVMMLGSESATLAWPKQAGFSLGRLFSPSNDKETCSVNNVTLTVLDAR